MRVAADYGFPAAWIQRPHRLSANLGARPDLELLTDLVTGTHPADHRL